MADSFIRLTGLSSKVHGLSWEADEVLRLGRHASVDIVLQDSSVERVHAEIKFQGQRWILRPLTENPYYVTRLNDLPVPARGLAVQPNDVLQIGNISLRVAALGAQTPSSPAPQGGELAKQDTQSLLPPRPAAAPPKPQPTISEPTPHPVPIDPGPSIRTEEPTRPGFLVLTGAFRRPNLAAVRKSGPDSKGDVQVLRVEATAQQSWDQALEQATLTLNRRPNADRTLLTLLRTNHHLSNVSRLDDLLQNILVDILGALGAQRGTILLFDPKSDRLELRAKHAPHPAAAKQKGYSRTLAERCFRQGESTLCRDLQNDHDPNAARSAMVGSMSSIICALLRTPRQHLGVLHLDRGPLDEPFTETDLYLADAIAANVAVGIECAQLVETQSEQFLQTVTTLARAVEMRDQYTGDHTRRVTEFALLLADDLKVSAVDRYRIEIGTPLHDIGKIGIDDAVLRKPGKLTPSEYEHMKTHTVKGAAMLEGFAHLAPILPIVRHHHERWDGTGYPDNLERDRTALIARIVAVADAFDAMTSHRPYRSAMPPQLAYMELLSKAGAHFDPNVVQSFVRLRPRVDELMRSHEPAAREARG